MDRTLVLSDLHLGRVTTHAHAPELIAPLVKGFDRVLLLGDIIDHWYTHPQEARELEERLLRVCRAGGAKKVIYFRGNHDACTADGEEFLLQGGMLYLHGHAVYHRLRGAGSAQARIEALNTRKFGSRRAASRAGRRVWKVVDRVYGSIPMALLNPIAWPWPVVRRIKALVKEVAPQGAVRGVVLGHSHRPGVRHVGDLTLFNLGGWMRNTRACAFIREDNHVKLVYIENRSRHPRFGHILYQMDLPPAVAARKSRMGQPVKAKP
ncbi:MAG: metallophosphoesterase family protein [Planctomycetota bacterium]|nr:metallophosphoesterase family protein [Planctomycetota bacterium]